MRARQFFFNNPLLTSIQLCGSDVGFSFGAQTVRCISPFEVLFSGEQRSEHFQPETRTGQIGVLWTLVGREALYYTYDEQAFEVRLRGDVFILCRNTHKYVDVEFFGSELSGGVEYFRFPEIIKLLQS